MILKAIKASLYKHITHGKEAVMQRGGKRKGAGRKPMEDDARVLMAARVKPITLKKLKKRAKVLKLSLGKFIDLLLDKDET